MNENATRTLLPRRGAAALWADPRLPYAALLGILLICHLQYHYEPADEAMYGSIMANLFDFPALFAFLAQHYQTWSARMLTEALFCIFSLLPPLVWRLLNPVLITVTAWCIAYALRLERSPAAGWLLCCLVYLYQWPYLADAGWIVTTIAYLWPVCFGLVALLPLLRLARGLPVSRAAWVGCAVALLFACNMEQPALLMPLFLGAGMLWLWRRRGAVPAGLWVYLALSLASLVFIFTCPGNQARTENDIASFFMDYPMQSVVHKAEIGISGAIAANVYGRDSVFYLFALVTALALWQRRAPWLARLLGLVPCLLLLPLSIFRYQAVRVLPGIALFTESYSAAGYLTLANCGAPTAYLPLLLGYGLFALCLLGIYGAFGWGKTTLHSWLLLAAGGMSQAAMGFTPSAGVSSRRTGIFFSFCIIAATGVLLRGLGEKGLRKPLRLVLVAACVVLSLIQLRSLLEM